VGASKNVSDLVSLLSGCQVVWGCLVIFYLQPELCSPQEKMVLHLIAEPRFLIFFIFASVRHVLVSKKQNRI